MVLGKVAGKGISVVRPVLDLKLSYVDSEDELVFDQVVPHPGRAEEVTRLLLPAARARQGWPAPGLWMAYHPHTTGKADVFRTEFLQELLSRGQVNSPR